MSTEIKKNANVHVRKHVVNDRVYTNFEVYVELNNGKKVAIEFEPKFVSKKFRYLLIKNLDEVK